jgi:hypothetical protein
MELQRWRAGVRLAAFLACRYHFGNVRPVPGFAILAALCYPAGRCGAVPLAEQPGATGRSSAAMPFTRFDPAVGGAGRRRALAGVDPAP